MSSDNEVQLAPSLPSFWSPCWLLVSLRGRGNESPQAPGSPVEAASQDISEENMFVSHKIGSITKQVTEEETKTKDLQGKRKCLKILHRETTLGGAE